MVSIAHLSDIHLGPMPRVRLQELMSKRITGYLNWKFNRAKHMQRDTLVHLIDHMRMQNPGFVAITGDLVNLSLDNEFERAAQWVHNIGPAKDVCVIPGNHDVYVPGALEKFQRAMGKYGEGEVINKKPFPFVRRVKDAAIICCNSAIATRPFSAYGAFDQEQAERLEKCLNLMESANYFRIVLIHHPPVAEYASEKRRGLRGANLFRDVIAKSGAELVLHGHIHRSVINALDGPKGEVPVIGVAAASADAKSGEDPARYNLFDIERIGTKWSCSMREYGYQRIGEEIVLRLQMKIY